MSNCQGLFEDLTKCFHLAMMTLEQVAKKICPQIWWCSRWLSVVDGVERKWFVKMGIFLKYWWAKAKYFKTPSRWGSGWCTMIERITKFPKKTIQATSNISGLPFTTNKWHSTAIIPKTNGFASKHRPSQKESSLPTIHFHVLLLLVSGRLCKSLTWFAVGKITRIVSCSRPNPGSSHPVTRFSGEFTSQNGGGKSCQKPFNKSWKFTGNATPSKK